MACREGATDAGQRVGEGGGRGARAEQLFGEALPTGSLPPHPPKLTPPVGRRGARES